MTAVQPWQVWWVDLDPTEGREHAGRRPVLVVSSAFHLRLTGEALVTVLPGDDTGALRLAAPRSGAPHQPPSRVRHYRAVADYRPVASAGTATSMGAQLA
ncbi:type II toxin-antitoxin system PemK/MazF family toxin [Dactylosporangium sp. NPDC049525]|uniref:type II toxin-antitoxin system PemK/MazF family toxin n=1 Tax=Dactylosporangium sp. NPDC049525 TaxID=3154730 RepID=UPI00341B2936